MKKLAPLCSWTLALLSAGALDPVWTNVSKGLTGSVPGVSQLVIDRATGSTFYALTSGGVFKSIDSGSSWTAEGNIGGVNILALDPASSVVYAGTSAGLFKSTDAGDSWASVGLSGTSIVALAIDPITPSTLYAGGNGHLYKSTDRGTNWTDLDLAPPGTDGLWIAGLVLDPSTPSTLYVALGQGAGGNIIKSVDGGATWNVIYANAGPFYNTLSNLVIDPSNPSTLYRINPMKKSTDGGVSWSQTAFTNSVSALTVDPRNSNTLYVSSVGNAGHAIYKSTDGGQNWDVVDTIIPPTGSFVFSPDSSTIYAATGSGVFKSTDGGLNWGEAKTGLSVLSIRMLAGDPVNTATIYSGGDDGLFKSVDSAGNWEKQAAFVLPAGGPFGPGPAEVHSLLVDFTKAKTLYLGIARPGGCYSGDVLLFKSTDGGATWNNGMGTYSVGIGCDGTIDAMAMDPIDPNTLYLPFGDDCCFDFTILKTTDGGAHWENSDTRGLEAANEVNALVIDRQTPATLYVATDAGVFQSTDNGALFIPAGFANTTVVLLAIDPVHSNVLYAATSSTFDTHAPGFLGLFRSTNSGASWSPINQGLEDVVVAHAAVNALLVDAADTSVLYLATSGFGVFRSSDGGATWAPFNNGLTYLDVTSLTIVHRPSTSARSERRGPSSPGTLYAGTPGGVFEIRE